MADAWHHAISSAKKWGGTPEDYHAIHLWFDGSKEIICDFRRYYPWRPIVRTSVGSFNGAQSASTMDWRAARQRRFRPRTKLR
jgi:hypothetical protein